MNSLLPGGGSILGSMMSGFFSSAATQMVGMALGVVDHVSFKQAVADGLMAGVRTGVARSLSGVKALWDGSKLPELNSYGKIAAAAPSVPAGYAVNRAIGLPASFSWHNAIMAGITSELNQLIGARGQFKWPLITDELPLNFSPQAFLLPDTP